MANQPVNHFLLVPLMSQSHLIPFTDTAKVLASHGQQVTIVMTPLNAARFNSIIDYAKNFKLKIQFLSLSFPGQEVGLPVGCENVDSLPSLYLHSKFFQASNMLQGPLEEWLRGLESLPSCIISDFCLPWTSDLALKFKFPRFVLHTTSCFTMLCSQINDNKAQERVFNTSESESVLEPDKIEFSNQLPESRKQSSNDLMNLLSKFKEAEASASGVLFNSFEELESAYVKKYHKFVKNLWCIGPLALYNNKITSIQANDQCLNWLDTQKPSSVIYVCFGSLSTMLPPQLIELGLGLESSNSPFIWVIGKGNYTPELENWFKEQNFDERLQGRGFIIRGWAPQMLILSHPATGGFLTHCGWNSTLEGISAGLPMIAWPMFAEQFANEKLIVQMLKIGVSIAAEKESKMMVKSEDVKNAIKQLVDGGKEGEDRRKTAQTLGKMAKRAVEEGGSSYLNVTILLIQHVNQQIEAVGSKCVANPKASLASSSSSSSCSTSPRGQSVRHFARCLMIRQATQRQKNHSEFDVIT